MELKYASAGSITKQVMLLENIGTSVLVSPKQPDASDRQCKCMQIDMGELHRVILRAHLIKMLKKKWFLEENKKTSDQEVKERFSWIDLAKREDRIEQVNLKTDEIEMYIDLHPFTNTTPYTVMESMSVAKAMVLFRQVGLRHMLILPKHRTSRTSPVVGILTRQDLMSYNILSAFPHLARNL